MKYVFISIFITIAFTENKLDSKSKFCLTIRSILLNNDLIYWNNYQTSGKPRKYVSFTRH